jgi:hypothetical protein
MRVLHLAFDHASVRMLHDTLQRDTEHQHHWWIDPDYHIPHRPHPWVNPLYDKDVHAMLAEGVDVVFVHRLKGRMLQWIQRVPPDVPVVWASWGDDYYRYIPALNEALFLPRTRLLNAALGKFSVTWIRVKQAVQGRRAPFFQALERVDAATAFLEEEAPFLPYLDPAPRIYRSLYNQLPGWLHPAMCTEKSGQILLGTSGLNSGNHLDLMAAMRRARLPSGTRITGSLSYGCPRYRWAVDRLGRWMLPGWEAQFTHQGLGAYPDWLRTFSTLVVYNRSTQSTGALVLALWLGLRVWMREDAHFAGYFRSRGFVIGWLPDREIPEELGVPLPAADRSHNRALVESLFHEDAIEAAFRELMHDLETGVLRRRRAAGGASGGRSQ